MINKKNLVALLFLGISTTAAIVGASSVKSALKNTSKNHNAQMAEANEEDVEVAPADNKHIALA